MSKCAEIWSGPHALKYLACKKKQIFLNFSSIYFDFTVHRDQMSSGTKMDIRLFWAYRVIRRGGDNTVMRVLLETAFSEP